MYIYYVKWTELKRIVVQRSAIENFTLQQSAMAKFSVNYGWVAINKLWLCIMHIIIHVHICAHLLESNCTGLLVHVGAMRSDHELLDAVLIRRRTIRHPNSTLQAAGACYVVQVHPNTDAVESCAPNETLLLSAKHALCPNSDSSLYEIAIWRWCLNGLFAIDLLSIKNTNVSKHDYLLLVFTCLRQKCNTHAVHQTIVIQFNKNDVTTVSYDITGRVFD